MSIAEPELPLPALFERRFGVRPEAGGYAPGRVNLLGEHTDYNDGFVLPATIPQLTRIALAASRDGRDQFISAQRAAGDDPRFARYLEGCVAVLREARHAVPALLVYVDSEVPIGAGLSSSAALEVAMLRALRSRFSIALDDVELARAAQRAEVEHVGVRCGIMDQMAVSFGRPDWMLFLDTRSLERRLLPLPPGTALVVLDSGVSRALAASGYNERRAQCEAAARALGVPALRDLTDPGRTDALPPPLDRRARHVVTENARVQAALETTDAAAFGALMNASHASLRDDFEVSAPALDLLVGLLQRHPGVYGAKLTGAGFGGACVALVEARERARIVREVLALYGAQGGRGAQLV